MVPKLGAMAPWGAIQQTVGGHNLRLCINETKGYQWIGSQWFIYGPYGCRTVDSHGSHELWLGRGGLGQGSHMKSG